MTLRHRPDRNLIYKAVPGMTHLTYGICCLVAGLASVAYLGFIK